MSSLIQKPTFPVSKDGSQHQRDQDHFYYLKSIDGADHGDSNSIKAEQSQVNESMDDEFINGQYNSHSKGAQDRQRVQQQDEWNQ